MAAKANLLGKRKPEYDSETNPILRKPKQKSEDKTLYVANLSIRLTEISDIVDFFRDVGKVVRVRRNVNHKGKRVGDGFVEFVSADEAKKTLEKKNGESLHNREIILELPYKGASNLPPKYCIDHTVWYEDYPQLLREPPDFVEVVAVREKTVFIVNQALKKDALCDITNIIKMFKKVGKVVGVRLIVDHRGEHVGCGFVEFDTADEANKAVQEMDGYSIFLKMAEIAPYPFRPKYELAEKLWHEDNLRRGSIDLETRQTLKKKKAIFEGKKTIFDDEGKAHGNALLSLELKDPKSIFCGKKTIFSDDDR